IILTSHLSEQEVLEALESGACAYVMKDINTDILKMIIQTIKDGAMWIDPLAVPILRDKNRGLVPQRQMSRAMFREQHSNLTQREYEVLKLIVDGKSNNEIAEELTISAHTAKAHVCNIIQKLLVDDRTQAAVKALKEGLV
ncbi:MAG TPA: DNA-binding response regulator, partial [Cyanobacteria bacterium UBA10660]|nr:DNA-binding response regulator [Cyanobacteria bacterium UBA10660]